MRKLILVFLLVSSSAFAAKAPAPAKPRHPLDPLTQPEIELALSIIKKSDRFTPDTMFPYLLLQEPPKKEVLAFKPGDEFRREAKAIVFDRKKSKLAEVRVDLRKKELAEWKEIPGSQPSVMLSEFDEAPKIVAADPRFAEGMKRRGITDLSKVAIDTWGYGSPDSELSRTKRLLRAITYMKGDGKNFYARPIEGWTAIVNMDEHKVEKVIDTEALPVPPVESELDDEHLGPRREKLKPLRIVQPKGVSYTVDGQEVRWQNWSFRFTMHPREGLVLHLVRYNDHGRWRPVMYRASLSEMMVPYGHPDEHWTWRAAFDEGEYGIGRYSGSLEKGTDVPENAQLFDATFVDDFGKPYTTPNVVALYERDGGLLWKHFDMYSGAKFSRRSRELVISFITTISNYDYGLNWIFKQDGSLELEAQLTGIMLAKGSAVKTMEGHEGHDGHSGDLAYGHLVAPNVVAPHHQHFFNFRLDMDVDGSDNNSVAELNTEAIPDGKDNPGHNAFVMKSVPVRSESEGARDLSYAHQRKWLVYNPSVHNALGYPTGYVLVPGDNAAPYLQDSSPLKTRGPFVTHPVWFTQENDDEMNAAGPYPNQRATSDGLTNWMKADRSLENKDVVLWYTFCVTHAPRPEEWPLMSVARTGFKLFPVGFFDRNPALDVAK